MQRLDRHDRVFITRRKRARAVHNKPRLWFWVGQSFLGMFSLILASVALVVGSGIAVAYGVYNTYAAQLPDASIIESQQEEFETVRIYDRTGQHLLYESVDPRPFRGDRTYVPLHEMSPWVTKAAVALEDRDFWENQGINVGGLLRAFVSNAQGGSVQGGSSITQQLIKNVIIPAEERTQLADVVNQARQEVKDPEASENLAAISSALAATK